MMGNTTDQVLRYLDESQNEAFDYEYHSAEELAQKIASIRKSFPSGPTRILDVGGGNGVFMDRLLAAFPQAEGDILDISKMLLDRNVSNPRKQLFLGSTQDIDRLLGVRRYDVICINWVLHHLVGDTYLGSVENCRQTLRHLQRFLSPGGMIIVSENNYDGILRSNIPSRLIFALTSIKNSLAVKLIGRAFNTAGTGVCFQSGRAWRAIFAQADLAVTEYHQVKRWNHGWKKRLGYMILMLWSDRHGHYYLKTADTA